MTPDAQRRGAPRIARALVLTALCAITGHRNARAGDVPARSDTLRIPPPRVRAWQLGLARPDRLEHASLSFTLAAGTGLAGGSRTNAFLLALSLGTLKELRDRHHGGFDPVDLAADAIGAALGARAAGRR